MDTKFQTSFIPKRSSIVEQKVVRHRSASVVTFLGVIIFVVSLAGAVFSFVWKATLVQNQKSYQTALEDAETKYNPTLLNNLRKSSAKLELSKKILDNHVASSEIFSVLSKLTIEGVQFKEFEFVTGAEMTQGDVKVKLKGVGNSFSAIAYQSDVFGQSDRFGVGKLFRNPVIGDLALEENGRVGFTFSADISLADISYKKLLGVETANSDNP